ncbi:GNAT family N-acetyltransferase [Paenibacillus sp. CGMCC 1.16610]|uniref:GNAT family N-acetyltransferase n=1 Tax=Paenibacillus anseongense TaxID=2682845 RepID=A0ABW9U632_9BACL|nr:MULTISPECIES: GNAT family N-acetyltransferase [Paenibacillus]MBA2941770.1 GNAT family N-acetyltransferase [Paenibacillus sp. CGMCC 1.16610]MVQ34288.1 GNAT family N-acetyltransferase [Paenibacillus anseongense]
MTYIIREANPQDTKEISNFVSKRTGKMISPLHIENRLHFMRDNPDESLYVYEEENQILGTLGFRIRQADDAVVKFSEVSVISMEETDSSQAAADKLKSYAEQLAQEHACSGMWWITGSENHGDSRKAQQPLGFHETGYRFVKRFL